MGIEIKIIVQFVPFVSANGNASKRMRRNFGRIVVGLTQATFYDYSVTGWLDFFRLFATITICPIA